MWVPKLLLSPIKIKIFGPKRLNLAVYWPKFLIFMGLSKSFGTHITEKPPRQLAQIGRYGQKCAILTQKYIIWTQFGLFGPKILILTGGRKILVPM